MSLNSYSYLHDTIKVENHCNFIKIKINDFATNSIYEKNVTLADISFNCLDQYYELVQNCIDHKPGFLLKLNRFYDYIELETSYQINNLTKSEFVILKKLKFFEIDLLKLENKKLKQQINQMSKEIQILKSLNK